MPSQLEQLGSRVSDVGSGESQTIPGLGFVPSAQTPDPRPQTRVESGKPSTLIYQLSTNGQPLCDARVVLPPHSAAMEQRIRAREQAAHELGRREGEKALSQQLLRQRSELIELQNGVLNSLRQSISQVTREYEGAMVALALEIAGKLVADLPISTELVEAAVREALAHVEQKGKLTVMLNPMDFELLEQANSPVLLSDVGGEQLTFQSSASVTRGGCLVQTQFGVVDARRETKLESLRQSLESSCQ